jgi:2'-5' RNA ligase
MQISSYFVGVLLDSSQFVDLFVKLQRYIEKRNLQNCLQLHNILSLHISIYYFEEKLDKKTLAVIMKDLSGISSQYRQLKISVSEIKYFENNLGKRLCYLDCSPKYELKNINKYFAVRYKRNKILANQFSYIPHVSLFNILDPKKYNNYRKQIDQIIKEELKLINQANIFKSFNIFKVNSFFHPEIQIPL